MIIYHSEQLVFIVINNWLHCDKYPRILFQPIRTRLMYLTSPTLLYPPQLYPLRYTTLFSHPFAVCPSVCLSARTPTSLAGRKTDSDTARM